MPKSDHRKLVNIGFKLSHKPMKRFNLIMVASQVKPRHSIGARKRRSNVLVLY
ncbi:hypothetical protein [Kaarinaea lacus]